MQFLSKNFFAFVFAKRGAKVMLFLYSFQIFLEVFVFIILYYRISLDCGCKGRHFLVTHQMFSQLFCEKF